MKILGIDLGSYSIKIAELDVSSKSFTFSNFFEINLSVEHNRDRNLQIIEELRRLVSKYEPNSTRFVIGVPQHLTSVHFKRFPFRERSKILKSLAFELEDDIPLDIDETIFDFKVVEYVGQQTDVLTVASPFDEIKELLSLAKDCGFDPEIISVEGLALANIFERWQSPPPEVSPMLRMGAATSVEGVPGSPAARSRLVVHIGHSRTLLLVYRETGLVAVRSILWGGADIANGLMRAFNVPIHEAIKILTGKAFILMNSAGANQDQLKLSQTVAGQVDLLLKDLKLILLDVKSEFNLTYDEIELMGGACQIQNLGPYITQGLEIPANVNLQSLSKFATRLTMSAEIEAIAPVAVGLAIEGMKRPRNPAVNLRKDDFTRENLNLKRFWKQWRVPAQVATGALIAFFVFSIIRDQVATSLLSTADEKVVEAAKTAAGIKGAPGTLDSKIRSHIRTQRTLIANQQAFAQLDGYLSAMDVLARISEKLPGKAAQGQGLDISLFDLDNEDLTIKGKAQNPALIPMIERALKDMAQPKSFASVPADVGGFGYKLKVNRKE